MTNLIKTKLNIKYSTYSDIKIYINIIENEMIMKIYYLKHLVK